MDTIFHEKQDGLLCAQHCLNALLQGEYFTAVDLATLAQQMDDEERMRMEEGGVHSEDYHRFLQQPSGNMDDSGFFSVQVISSALKVWNLELIPYNSRNPLAQTAQADPTVQKAYICNYKDHWFTVRRIGRQWYNLNSLLSGPELISTTYLSMFLTQLQQEGYAIFIVMGILPECVADQVLGQLTIVQTSQTRRNNQDSSLEDDVELQAALCLSLSGNKESQIQQTQPATSENLDDDEEKMLQTALRMSMEST